MALHTASTSNMFRCSVQGLDSETVWCLQDAGLTRVRSEKSGSLFGRKLLRTSRGVRRPIVGQSMEAALQARLGSSTCRSVLHNAPRRPKLAASFLMRRA